MKRKEKFYGWKMMPAIWMIYFLGCGPSVYGISMLSTNLVLQYGWSESVIGLASGVVQYSIAVLSFVVTFYIRKKGYKNSIVLGGIVGTVGFFLLTVYHVSPVFYVAMMAAAGFCDAFSCLVSIPGLINNWFERNKAFPMSLVLCSGAVAGFVMPVLAAQLLERSITFCLAVYTLMTMVIIILGKCCIVDEPKQVGEVRDGHAWIEAHSTSETKIRENESGTAVSLTDCYHTKPFWMLLIVMIAYRSIYMTFSTFIVIYAVRNGVGTGAAALLLTVGNVAGLLGRLCSGVIDRLRIPYRAKHASRRHGLWYARMGISCHLICCGSLALMGLSGVMIFFAAGYAGLLCGSILLGFTFGFLQTLFPLLLPMYFGENNFSSLFGTYNMLGGIFSGTMPLIISAVFPLLGGDYRYIFLILAFPSFLAAFLSGTTPAKLVNGKVKEV